MAGLERMVDYTGIFGPFLLVALATFLVLETLFRLLSRSRREAAGINSRLKLIGQVSGHQEALVELRRKRGLSTEGGYVLPIVSLNRLVLQSGLEVKPTVLLVWAVSVAGAVTTVLSLMSWPLLIAGAGGCAFGIIGPLLFLATARTRRMKKLEEQLPDAVDVMVRSLRAGHPVPVAIAMVGREMPDPVGTEFGLVSDEMTYGLDLATAMGNLRERTGQTDVALMVVAVTIQSKTGGNLAELLGNLSRMIRERYRMRRKIKALSAEGRFSSIALSVVPLAIYLIVRVMSPAYYGDVQSDPIFMPSVYFGLTIWAIGIVWLRRMVNFKI